MKKLKLLLVISMVIALCCVLYWTSSDSPSSNDHFIHQRKLNSIKPVQTPSEEQSTAPLSEYKPPWVSNEARKTGQYTHVAMTKRILEDIRLSLNKLQCKSVFENSFNKYINELDITTLSTSTTFNNKKAGFVLCLSFREQQTKASENLFSLQCWAKTLGLYVVEPFVYNSHFVAPLNDTTALLKFRDVFNIQRWQRLTSNKLSPLAGWDVFTRDAPRDLIVVYFKFPKYAALRDKRDNNEKATHLATGDAYTKGCKISAELNDTLQNLVTGYKFNIVKRVCINFEFGDELTLFQFNSQVFGNYRPDSHTVIVDEWRGTNDIASGNRVSVYNQCYNEGPFNPVVASFPSYKVICDTERYFKKYLRSEPYIALIVRTEKFKQRGVDMDENRISTCFNRTLEAWRSLKQKTNIRLTYLSMDVGKYGSYSLHDRWYTDYIFLYEEFIREVLGANYSISKWESEFESIASSLDSGYIGSLQKSLVARSKCVIFSGGGSFQKHTQFMYNSLHKRKCVKTVQSCSRM